MDDPHKSVSVPPSKLIDVAGSPNVLEGRARQRCEGCGQAHGSVSQWINCLTTSLLNSRRQIAALQNDPDLQRGREVRRHVEEFRRFPVTTNGHAHEMSLADRRGRR